MRTVVFGGLYLDPLILGNLQVKTLFWGIVDLKYDAFKPVLDRIQVLETGRVEGLGFRVWGLGWRQARSGLRSRATLKKFASDRSCSRRHSIP